MCGRSFGKRPYAFVTLFGSRPNVAVGKAGATVLTCGSAAAAPLDDSSPQVLEKV
jgi:hypothetical protein